ncbi:TetR/AcrR family transcriptional regulator [Streptomyces sp. FXJ1.172]|uniref:TetR/AcrR family transcriptional regulator n=1 Tax=Streptomyces sp. FXJ1.172 TaxID=710705 RepID=UPI0007CF065F|nr:TetR/AcrR family transcriptional regulator [Streptomyces sp. FXJ1.172]WEO99796.1 TetR/AcrR family transcriptional regulator [Streptomyces sp. FXJ1.172]
MGRPKQFEPGIAVSAAMEVFWRKGYAATTPQDLVDALGIGKGSLYHAFGSKQKLFLLALRHYGDAQVAALAERLRAPGPVKDRLRAALQELAQSDLADPDLRGCLAVNTSAELISVGREAAAVVRSVFDRIESVLRAVVEEGRRAGEFDARRDPQEIASGLLAVIVGMHVLARTADGPDRLNRIITAALLPL